MIDKEDLKQIKQGNLIFSEKGIDNLKEVCYNGDVKSFKEENIEEDIEKHDELNPKLWDSDNHLKPEVREKLLEIVDDFVDGLKEDGIDIDVEDVILVGSSASYNYTKDSDIDLHIIADHKKTKANYELLPLLYSAYRSIYNKNYDISFYGIPVELYVEMDDDDENVLQESKTNTKSNGIYSVQDDKWIKEPVQQDIPDIDRDAFNEIFKEYEDRYFEILDNATIEEIEDFIDDLYNLRKEGLANDGEYSLENLVFKEARNLGYLDELKELKNKLKSKQLSLEELDKIKENKNMPVKSCKKPELKEAENQKPLQKSPYKQEIGKYFDYTMDFEFLDVVAEILDRIDFSVKDVTDDDTDYEEDLYEEINQEIDNALIYTEDRWTIFEFYVEDPSDVDEYTWSNCIDEFTNDIYSIVEKIKGEEREADDIEYEEEDEEKVEVEDEE